MRIPPLVRSFNKFDSSYLNDLRSLDRSLYIINTGGVFFYLTAPAVV